MIGIYKIENKITNKMYIGSSKNISVRFIHHKSLLENNKHHSLHLQRAWNKYGKENFEFSIIEECSIKILLEREQYYLDFYLKANEYINGISDYFIENGYNILPLSIKGFTGKHSRNSILKQLKSRGFSEIYKVDLQGNILNIYDMISEIEDSNSSIFKSIKTKNTLRTKDYGYIRAEDYFIDFKPIKLISWNKNKKYNIEIGKSVFVYDIYGRFYKEFSKITLCAKHFKVPLSSISSKLNKKRTSLIGNSNLSFYNFFTTKQNNNLNFINISNIGELKVFTMFNEYIGNSNFKELCYLLNVKKTSIQEVINNRRKQIKGYIIKCHNDIV